MQDLNTTGEVEEGLSPVVFISQIVSNIGVQVSLIDAEIRNALQNSRDPQVFRFVVF